MYFMVLSKHDEQLLKLHIILKFQIFY